MNGGQTFDALHCHTMSSSPAGHLITVPLRGDQVTSRLESRSNMKLVSGV